MGTYPLVVATTLGKIRPRKRRPAGGRRRSRASRDGTHLRATIAITHLDSVGLTPPHFLIQCEELSPSAATARSEAETRLPHLARLIVREQEITRLTCEGRSNQEIADETGLSLQMVKKHLHAIFRTLEVASRSRLMALMR